MYETKQQYNQQLTTALQMATQPKQNNIIPVFKILVSVSDNTTTIQGSASKYFKYLFTFTYSVPDSYNTHGCYNSFVKPVRVYNDCHNVMHVDWTT